MTRNEKMRTVLLALALAGLMACGKTVEPAPSAPVASASPPAVAPAAAIVAVAAEGTRFDPAIRPDQVPPGAWYCDMGTVHYARLVEGDGRCGICAMKLKHKAP